MADPPLRPRTRDASVIRHDESAAVPMKLEERALLQERVKTLVLGHALEGALARFAEADQAAGGDTWPTSPVSRKRFSPPPAASPTGPPRRNSPCSSPWRMCPRPFGRLSRRCGPGSRSASRRFALPLRREGRGGKSSLTGTTDRTPASAFPLPPLRGRVAPVRGSGEGSNGAGSSTGAHETLAFSGSRAPLSRPRLTPGHPPPQRGEGQCVGNGVPSDSLARRKDPAYCLARLMISQSARATGSVTVRRYFRWTS